MSRERRASDAAIAKVVFEALEQERDIAAKHPELGTRPEFVADLARGLGVHLERAADKEAATGAAARAARRKKSGGNMSAARRMTDEGKSIAQIALALGVSRTTISRYRAASKKL